MTLQSLLDQAVALHRSGRHAEAERQYQQVLAANPQIYPAQYLLALLRVQQQRFSEAEPAMAAALTLNPTAPEALTLQGALRRATGRHEEALASYDALLALYPDHFDSWFARGSLLLELERLDAALASFDKALAANPASAVTWNNRGAVLHALGRFHDEVESYQRAVAADPNYAQGWNNLGLALQKLKRFEEALASCGKALALESANARAWTLRAISLQGLERYDEALAAANKALALQPDNADALFARAEILCESSRVAEGFSDFRRHAALYYKPLPGPAHQQRHHAEQRAWLAARGIKAKDFHVEGGERLAGEAVSLANGEDAAAQWAASRMAVVDNLLTPEALEQLRRFCWGSTMWSRAYESGYLAAMPATGLASPLMAQIADELRTALPAVLGAHSLHMFWGFCYDSHLTGTDVHADEAAVNVNFWITPDDANLDPHHGGLVVWDKAAPPDWDFVKFNSDQAAIRDFLKKSGAASRTVPYRANRAVIFDSDLFHKTDAMNFKDGYTDRRINLTLLYGRRVKKSP